MKTPAYGTHQGQPFDVFRTLRASYHLSLILGQITIDGKPEVSLHTASRRSAITFSAITGLDVVVSENQAFENVSFEDGVYKRYQLVTLYSAEFAGGSQAKLRGELKRSGYTHQDERTLTEAQYLAAVGGTGSYAGATSYHRITVRAGAGRTIAPEAIQFSNVAEVGQGGTGGEGGYEFTGGFSDRLAGQSGENDFGTLVSYTQDMADNDRWLRFGFSESARDANDSPYFPIGSNYDGTKGLFGGEHLPRGCQSLISFNDSTSYNDAVIVGDFQYTAAGGSLDFSTCRVGDLALVRFDFNVVPQVANTTIEIAMIWQTRDEDNNATFTFPLTGTPVFYGNGTVGKTFLNRPLISAYFASEEDVNARALLAIRSDNPVQIAPLTTLVTIQR